MSPGPRANDRKTTQQDLQTGQTGQTSSDQSRSQALSPPSLKKICGGCQMCVPRSTDRPTRSPIKSRLKSVLGSVLPTSNAKMRGYPQFSFCISISLHSHKPRKNTSLLVGIVLKCNRFSYRFPSQHSSKLYIAL